MDQRDKWLMKAGSASIEWGRGILNGLTQYSG